MQDPTLLFLHVALCFMALALGFVAIQELRQTPYKPQLSTKLFLITGLPATLTGFLLPFATITPAVKVGIISTLVFILLLTARFAFRYKGPWRIVYAAGIVTSVFFLAFVTVAQSFTKIPALKAIAPTGTEPPFAIAAGIVLILFVFWGRFAVKDFRP